MTAYLVGQHPVGSFASPTNGTLGDADTVRGNDNAIATEHDAHDADPKLHLQQGPIADRPAAGTAGQVYLATDTYRLYVDTGAAWVEVRYQVVDASGNVVVGGALSLQGATATTGALRLAYGTGINARNSTNTADVAILYTTTAQTHIGSEGTVAVDSPLAVLSNLDGDGVTVSGNVNNVGLRLNNLATSGKLWGLQSSGGGSGFGAGRLVISTGAGAGVPMGFFDQPVTAGYTSLALYDVNTGTLQRVQVGAADSGGAGFRMLRVPN